MKFQIDLNAIFSLNWKLIENLFGSERLIQNPNNFPDITHSIENILGYLKPGIKKKFQNH